MLVGYHLANDGGVTDEHYQMLRNANVGIVKVLLRLDLPLDLDWFERLHDNLPRRTEVVLRLYMPGHAKWAPDEFCSRSIPRLHNVLPILRRKNQRTTWIEVHNEPNHPNEGWGPTLEGALGFGNWFKRVYFRMKQSGIENVGFPGLAVGEWAHRERTWGFVLRGIMTRADWVGAHCYWQTGEDDWQLRDSRLGHNWKWYAGRFEKVIVTEAGNSNHHGVYTPLSPGEQANQYKSWCDDADVHGVTFFILGGSDDWKGFQVHPETVALLGGEVIRTKNIGMDNTERG